LNYLFFFFTTTFFTSLVLQTHGHFSKISDITANTRKVITLNAVVSVNSASSIKKANAPINPENQRQTVSLQQHIFLTNIILIYIILLV
jgi:hypothetical protein